VRYVLLVHLYVHVPFCQRRCSYCDFSIAVRKRIPVREYLDAVLHEAAALEAVDVETIYFGGGTPSLLPPEAIATLLDELTLQRRTPHVGSTPHAAREVTLEANPEDVTPDRTRAWRAAGINRISLGAQSFDDRVLHWMHRSHDAARIGAAVHALRGAGIDNISLDLIFGLPEELKRNWERDLDMLCSLLPAHCSLYGLTVEPRTPLDRWISRGAVHAPDDSRYADEYLQAHARLATAGLEFYEVSNAARVGYRSKHNSAYWSGRPYIGLGPAAHSFDGQTRRWNLSAWEAYRRAIAEGRSPVESEETLTEEQRELETIYLGLRTIEGVPLGALRRLSASSAAIWADHGWIEQSNDRLRCTAEGWLRLDALVRDLTLHTVRS
jgi:oxygen-independent coproporphyrinogen-3 oxidase